MEYKKLSKTISYILRHHPESIGLNLDDHGFAEVDKLLAGINALGKFPRMVTLEDVIYMMSIMEKKRFEIVGKKIRAFYGHSFAAIIEHAESVPPKILYHGTAHKFELSIATQGLLPMSRQHVHLSADINTAIAVGKRKDKMPLVFAIDTEQARKQGIKFYVGNQDVWLAEGIPPELLKEVGNE